MRLTETNLIGRINPMLADGKTALTHMENPNVCSFLGMPAVISSEALQKVMCFVQRIARGNAAVLMTGESGSGKELIARPARVFAAVQEALDRYQLRRAAGPPPGKRALRL